MKKGKGLVLGSALALLITGGVVQASEYWVGYTEFVNPFNGSAFTNYSAMTGYEKFTETISVRNSSVQGDYVVDIRARREDGYYRLSDWVRNVGDNRNFTINRSIKAEAGSRYQLEISNDLTTPVVVRVDGTFKTY